MIPGKWREGRNFRTALRRNFFEAGRSSTACLGSLLSASCHPFAFVSL